MNNLPIFLDNLEYNLPFEKNLQNLEISFIILCKTLGPAILASTFLILLTNFLFWGILTLCLLSDN